MFEEHGAIPGAHACQSSVKVVHFSISRRVALFWILSVVQSVRNHSASRAVVAMFPIVLSSGMMHASASRIFTRQPPAILHQTSTILEHTALYSACLPAFGIHTWQRSASCAHGGCNIIVWSSQGLFSFHFDFKYNIFETSATNVHTGVHIGRPGCWQKYKQRHRHRHTFAIPCLETPRSLNCG